MQAARVSYGKGTKRVSEDRGLIQYLMRHRHTTPFEMCEIKYHVKLPIFVARQWIRHRTANVNEYSARYSILDREFYLPAPEHLAAQSAVNRQGRGTVLTGDEAAHVLGLLREFGPGSVAVQTVLLKQGVETCGCFGVDVRWPRRPRGRLGFGDRHWRRQHDGRYEARRRWARRRGRRGRHIYHRRLMQGDGLVKMPRQVIVEKHQAHQRHQRHQRRHPAVFGDDLKGLRPAARFTLLGQHHLGC